MDRVLRTAWSDDCKFRQKSRKDCTNQATAEHYFEPVRYFLQTVKLILVNLISNLGRTTIGRTVHLKPTDKKRSIRVANLAKGFLQSQSFRHFCSGQTTETPLSKTETPIFSGQLVISQPSIGGVINYDT